MSRAPGSPLTAERLAAAYGDVPFRVADAVAAGLATRHAVRSCVRVGQLVLLRPGVAVPRAVLDTLADDPYGLHLVQLRGAQLALHRPGWASLDSGAYVHDLPRRLGAGAPRAVHLDVPGLPDAVSEPMPSPLGAPALLPVHLHGSGLPDWQRDVVAGIPVTSLARTAVEHARHRPLHLALVPVDAALRRLTLGAPPPDDREARRRLADRPGAIAAARRELSRVVESMRGWPGIVAAREALAYADPRAESPLESCSRGHVLERGLRSPEVGVPVVGEDGRTYYGDLVWRAERVVGEADGWSKYGLAADPMQRLREEKRREDALRRAGWLVVRWTSDELRDRPASVVARISAALAEGRARHAG